METVQQLEMFCGKSTLQYHATLLVMFFQFTNIHMSVMITLPDEVKKSVELQS